MRNNMEIAKHSVGNHSFENSWSNMTYHWEVNLLKIKILFSYLENILISRLYEQFSRKWSNLGHFCSSKNFKLRKIWTYHTLFWNMWSGDVENVTIFVKYANFAILWALFWFLRNIVFSIKWRNFRIILQNK